MNKYQGTRLFQVSPLNNTRSLREKKKKFKIDTDPSELPTEREKQPKLIQKSKLTPVKKKQEKTPTTSSSETKTSKKSTTKMLPKILT